MKKSLGGITEEFEDKSIGIMQSNEQRGKDESKKRERKRDS